MGKHLVLGRWTWLLHCLTSFRTNDNQRLCWESWKCFFRPILLSTVGDKELLLGNNFGDQTYWGETVLDKTNWRAENIQH